MLHEPAAGSAARLFRGRPVLRWTLDRLRACGQLSAATILCWDDQAEAARAAAGDDALVLTKGVRNPPAALAAVSAARRWADGWRGGLLGTCAFDAGFVGLWAREAAAVAEAEAIVLIDPAAGLLDAALIDELIDHAAGQGSQEICFLPAAPGLGAALLRKSLLDRLAAAGGLGSHPGRLLHYHPTQVSREMLGGEACARVPTAAARTVHSFLLSSRRQISLLEAATKEERENDRGEVVPAPDLIALKMLPDKHASACHPERSEGSLGREAEETLRCAQGDGRSRQIHFQSSTEEGEKTQTPELSWDDGLTELASAGAEQLVERVNHYHRASQAQAAGTLPREVVLELNTCRASSPLYWAGRCQGISRPAMPAALARELIDELSQLDDSRLTLAGVGDPLLAEAIWEIVEAARAAGLAVHLETDLLGVSADAVRALAGSGLDVLSVHLPALTQQTYAVVMGVDRYREALGNIETFVRERAVRQRAVPLLAPLFVKCVANLAEMEAWYDQWLRAAGSAVIIGPSDFVGLAPDAAAAKAAIAVADMAPPRRRPCARLSSRLTVLSDGQIVSCEQDVLGRQAVGRIGQDRLADVWKEKFAALRAVHAREAWAEMPLCGGCREWHRP